MYQFKIINPQQYQFVIFTKPMPKERPRLGRHTTYTPMRTRAFKNLLSSIFKDSGVKICHQALRLDIEFLYERPKSVKKNMIYKATRPDRDNLDKSILDAGNGILYKDDAQVVDGRIQKKYSDLEPSIIINAYIVEIIDLKKPSVF